MVEGYSDNDLGRKNIILIWLNVIMGAIYCGTECYSDNGNDAVVWNVILIVTRYGDMLFRSK